MAEISSLEQIRNASRASFKSRDKIEKSNIAGCFYCAEIFPVSEIKEWADGGLTPICPRCGIDSVLGDALGYPLNKENLEIIHNDRFGLPKKVEANSFMKKLFELYYFFIIEVFLFFLYIIFNLIFVPKFLTNTNGCPEWSSCFDYSQVSPLVPYINYSLILLFFGYLVCFIVYKIFKLFKK